MIKFEDTHQYVHDTLPNADALNFIINSLPTKTNNIWRALVDLEKVYAALHWLKEHNILYLDVKIIEKNMLKGSSMIFEEIAKNSVHGYFHSIKFIKILLIKPTN